MNRTIFFRSTLFFLCLLQTGRFLPYIATQGYYQAKLLCGREPIAEALKQNSLDALQREKLKTILDVRLFTTQYLAFTPNDNYTTVNLRWDYKIFNVSASKPLQFEPYTWWFPIVGRLPYKGFFNKSGALKERDRLMAKNLDVQMQLVSGYSSLGYFKDPVLPQMLKMPLVFLVELIIHELAHATIYFKNQTDFNESFANAVGKIGALAFFAQHFGRNSAEHKEAVLLYQDQSLYNASMWKLYQELNRVYESNQTDKEKKTLKERTIHDFASSYQKISFSTPYFENINLGSLNNASLMSFKRYHSEQTNFERLLDHFEHNWQKFILNIRSLEKAPDPFVALSHLAEKL